MTALIPVAVALVPVLLFLAGLQLMDSFKLVRIEGGADGDCRRRRRRARRASLSMRWLLPATRPRR